MAKEFLSMALVLFLVACGENSTTERIVEVASVDAEIVSTVKDLPKCSQNNEGEIVWVKNENSARICVDGEWPATKDTLVIAGDTVYLEKEGVSCTTKELKDKSGLKILCNGDSVGVVLNGSSGKDGSGCSIKEKTEGDGYELLCGDSVVTVKNGADGQSIVGSKGGDGKSAYEIAKEKDPSIASEEEWLESLKGVGCSLKEVENGVEVACGDSVVTVKNGSDGKSAYEIAKEKDLSISSEEEWLESLKGVGCSLKKVDNGVEITCGNSNPVFIKNGNENCVFEGYENGVAILKCGDDELMLGAPNVSYCGKQMYNPQTYFCDSRKVGEEQIYKYVTIGKQVWMAENLNYKMANSWCYGEKDENVENKNCAKYGRLYAWTAAVEGACPDEWHLPNNEEWGTLMEYVGGAKIAGKMLKSKTGWDGEDKYGFSILPSGAYYNWGVMSDMGLAALFWSASHILGSNAAYYAKVSLLLGDGAEWTHNDDKKNGFSVRCIKD